MSINDLEIESFSINQKKMCENVTHDLEIIDQEAILKEQHGGTRLKRTRLPQYSPKLCDIYNIRRPIA